MSAQPHAPIADHTRILDGSATSWSPDDELTVNLDFDDHTASFDESLPAPPAESPERVERAAPPAMPMRPTVAPGLVLRDRYLLQQVIGSGGTSMVYRAQDLRHESAPESTRVVALKLLREELRDDAKAIERLKREFAQMQLLAHPGVLKVFDLDVDRGTWFMTMELLEGQSLSMYLRTHREPHPQALDIVKACAEAMQFAHERGIVHGDLKPGNVFLTGAGVRLLDFIGAADEVRSDRAATPAYASPQRLAGELPDVSDDIYSLGCVAYELLSGVHPFDRKPATVARELGLQPVRINSLSYRQWRVLDRALAFDPRDRPPSMRSFLDALEHHEPKLEPGIRSAPPDSAASDGSRVEGIIPVAMPAVMLAEPADAERATSAAASSEAVTEAAGTAPPLTLRERETLIRPIEEASAAPAAALPPVFEAPGRSAALPVVVALLLAMLAAYLAHTELSPEDAQVASAPADSSTGAAPPPARTVAPSVPPQSEAKPVIAPTTAVSAAQASMVPVAQRSAASPQSGPNKPAAISQAKPKTANAAKPAPNAVGFQTSRVAVSERSVAAVVQVKRLGTSTAGRIPVRWRTEKRSALPGEDYEEVASGTLILQDGQRVGAIYVPIINDDIAESDEMFVVELIDTPNASTPDIGLTIVTIRDDDRTLLTAVD